MTITPKANLVQYRHTCLRCTYGMGNDFNFRKQFEGVTVDSSFKAMTHQLSSQPCFAKNRDGQYIYANSLFLEHCRVSTLSEILGKTDYNFFPSLLAEKYVHDDMNLFGNGKPLFNLLELVLNKDGVPAWQVTNKVPLYDQSEQVCGLIGVFEEPIKSTRSFPKINALIPAIDYIKDNFQNSIDMNELSKVAGMSARSFYRRFKETFNITPQNYLQKHRILNASEILKSGTIGISEVAQRCGFYDHSHFSREFKKHMNMTPRQFIAQSR